MLWACASAEQEQGESAVEQNSTKFATKFPTKFEKRGFNGIHEIKLRAIFLNHACGATYGWATKLAMLYERWRHIAQKYRSELALRDWSSHREWTFGQLCEQTEKP